MLVIWWNWTASLQKDCWKCGKEQGKSEAVSMWLALAKQRTRMTQRGSAAKYFVYESGCGKKVLLGRVKQERSTGVAFRPLKGWCNFHVGQSERGKWQNSKVVLLLTVEPEMKWYFLTYQVFFFSQRSFQFSHFFQFLRFFDFEKNTAVAR